MNLFDANASLGASLKAPPGAPTTADELLAEMDRLEIAAALVSHCSGCETDPRLGNERVDAEAGAHPRLRRVWTVVPDTGGDTPPAAEFVDRLVRSGARAAQVFPRDMNWCLDEWCAGPLLRALEERRVPLLLPCDQVGLRDLPPVLAAHPGLPAILLGASYRETRILCPLLERHANLYLSLSPPFAVQEGIERICARAGARHLVFGTGYPHAAPGAAITYLMYARITEEERRLIGAGNLERLLSEVAT